MEDKREPSLGSAPAALLVHEQGIWHDVDALCGYRLPLM